MQHSNHPRLQIAPGVLQPPPTPRVPELLVAAAAKKLGITAYFASPQGTKEIGYQGNVPLPGDYPGPTEEAFAHLDKALADLGLSEYAYS